MAATVGRLGGSKNILIHAKFDRFTKNNKYINQSTSNWTLGQHKRDLMNLLKATNSVSIFLCAVPNKGKLQALIEGLRAFQPPYLHNRKRIKAPDNAWQKVALAQPKKKMAAAVGRFGESKNTLIHAKFDRFNKNNNYIKQRTSNWTFGKHKRGLTNLLKATKWGFSYATVPNEGKLQAWIDGLRALVSAAIILTQQKEDKSTW